jgi:transcriptional regulator of aromatic amino acid metabolism
MSAETERLKAMKGLDLEAQKMLLDQWEAQAKFSLETRKQTFNEAAAAYEKAVIDKKMRQDPESVKAIAAVDS